jgi:drug/metabolite transporter (DMT)-like permease
VPVKQESELREEGGGHVLAALLALAASVCWGVGDVIAGLAGRRTSSWTVSLLSQVIGLVAGVGILIAMGRGWPSLAVSGPALVAGVAVALGMGAYFKALAVGTMSIVAPIAGSGAVVPVAVGLIRGEQPSILQAVGVIAAVVGVGLAVYDRHPEAGVVGTIEVGAAAPIPTQASSGAAAESGPGRRPRLAAALALVAAGFFGSSLVGYAETAAHDPYLPAVAGRASSVAVLVLLVGGLRVWSRRRAGTAGPEPAGAPADYSVPGFRLPRVVLPGVAAAGLLHLSAATLFSLSSTRGLLSLVSVLSSLGAAVTMGLAYYVVRERLEPQQVVGVALALLGVIAIAGAS